jgi:hypothetical protein
VATEKPLLKLGHLSVLSPLYVFSLSAFADHVYVRTLLLFLLNAKVELGSSEYNLSTADQSLAGFANCLTSRYSE